MKLINILALTLFLAGCTPTKAELFHFTNTEILRNAVAKYDARDGMYIVMDAKTSEIVENGFTNAYYDHIFPSHNLDKLITLVAGLNSGIFTTKDIVFNNKDLGYKDKVTKKDLDKVSEILEAGPTAKSRLRSYINVYRNKGNLLTEEQHVALIKALRENVINGPAKNANVEGAEVTGLTSTTQKYKNEREVVTLFVGTFKAQDKEYGIITVIDSPRGVKETWNFNSAGWNAVPLARDLIKSYMNK